MKIQKRTWIPVLATCLFSLSTLSFSDPVYAKKITSLRQAAKTAQKEVKNSDITEIDRDYKNGQLVYEVTLTKATKEYEITYRASDGKMLEYGWEQYSFKGHSTKKTLSRKKIQNLALKEVSAGKILSLIQKIDDGIPVYKIKLTQNSKKYTLKYHAKTGRLLEYKWASKIFAQRPTENNRYISMTKAKKIALSKVPHATIVKAEFDNDDGVPLYEIEAIKGAMEYDIKIHASSGKILGFDKDYNDDWW